VLVRCKCRIHGSFSTRETVKFHHVGIGLTQQIKHQHQYVYITKCIESFCLIIITLKQVALCVKFQLIPGKSVSSKSVHVNDGSAFLFLDGTAISSTVLHPYDENESLSQQLSKISISKNFISYPVWLFESQKRFRKYNKKYNLTR